MNVTKTIFLLDNVFHHSLVFFYDVTVVPDLFYANVIISCIRHKSPYHREEIQYKQLKYNLITTIDVNLILIQFILKIIVSRFLKQI